MRFLLNNIIWTLLGNIAYFFSCTVFPAVRSWLVEPWRPSWLGQNSLVMSLLVILSRLAENIVRLWEKNLVIDRLFMKASKRSAMHSLKQFWWHLKESPLVRDTRSQDQQVVLPESQLKVRSQEQRSSAGQGTANPIPSLSTAAPLFSGSAGRSSREPVERTFPRTTEQRWTGNC